MDAKELLTCAGLSAAASAGMAIGQFVVESGGFYMFNFLERRGLVRRFAPEVPFKLTGYSLVNAWAVGGSHLPLFFVLAFFRHGFWERAQPSLSPLSLWGCMWTTMVLHDAWFFWCHTLMHWSKPLYAALHRFHHTSTSDLNVFGTSYAEAMEFLFDWSLFYGCLLAAIYQLPSWNPVGLLLTLIPVSIVNIMGHSGFDLPMWVYMPLSLGILLTPGAQESKIHFIHHVDPRFNRSLYFTWWDRLLGTYKDRHRLVDRKASCRVVPVDSCTAPSKVA